MDDHVDDTIRDETMIEAFLQQMLEDYGEDIAAIDLPEGTHAYLAKCIRTQDINQLEFMLQLAYMLGLQTGYSIADAEDELDVQARTRSSGALQA